MKTRNLLKRLATMALSATLLAASAVTAFAAPVADATINMDAPCSMTLYKYDLTNAAKDGVWTENSYVSTGVYDQNINDILGGATRKGDDDKVTNHENGSTSNGYALKGVEYTYLKVADITQFSEAAKDGATAAHIEVLYKFAKNTATDLLAAIGLADGKDSYANANALDSTSWYYQSDVLNAAIAKAKTDNSTTLKNALEGYVAKQGGTAMPLTDENGKTEAKNLPVGLYLLAETKVPEMVTSSTDPFFVSLPMTSVNGGGNGQGSNTTQVTDGGTRWMYDVTLYPKNATGIVTLEKTVRESKKDTGKNNASAVITDGFAHNATASTNDIVEYQIISTLPTITSAATYLTDYTFTDLLSRGLTYDANTPVVVEWFSDAECTQKVATWNEADGKFSMQRTDNKDGTTTMKIAMTEAGLAEINAAAPAANNVNGALYAGYSNYTVRITYAAQLNPDESMVYGDAGNPNTVVLNWKRTSTDYFDTLIDDCHIYTYAINLTKKFSDQKEDQSLFDDVIFKVQNESDGYFVQATLNAKEGIWYVTGHTPNEEDATRIHPVDWNGKKGQIVIKGTEDDNYIMTEIETANGYTLLKENIKLDITSSDDPARPCSIYADQEVLGVIQNDSRYNFNGGLDLKLANIPQKELAHNYQTASATVDGNAVTMLNDESDTTSTNAIVPLSVVNTHGFDIPGSGSTAMLVMVTAGAALVIFGIIFIVARKKKEENA